MTSSGPHLELHCPIDLFELQEGKIEVLTRAINPARTASEKAPNAHMLIDEANVLLSCASYDRANRNCNLCRNFSELRLQTASLIVKADAAAGVR